EHGRRAGREAWHRLDADVRRHARPRHAEGDRCERRAGGDRRGAGVMRALTAAVALVGLGIATYLTIVHYAGGAPVCAIAHGCETVQRSSYAKVGGVPVALAGLFGYVAVLVSLVRDGEDWRLATAFLTIAGLGFSLWLTWVEV